MSFGSIHFLIFFPAVVALYWLLRRSATLRVGCLVIASYYFYMTWNVAYAGLIAGSTLLDFVLARAMHSSQSDRVRRMLLIASLTGNLGVLMLFKYYNFFLETLSSTGFTWGMRAHQWLLPVGISFYTFQTLSYTIDVYRRKITPTRNLLHFALFVSFFPQLVAGPIVRAADFLPQLGRNPSFDDQKAQQGLLQIFTGLIKKICIADTLGRAIVDPAFADPGVCHSATLLIAMYAYAFQIYYDFSGYSDVAIGAARMLGFDLPVNFNRPYLATSIRDFWRRWHISLSTWLRDYLYIPLGGSRGSTLATARNLAIVMILGGLWHGAAWGFVIWGIAHGLLLGAGRIFAASTGIDPDNKHQPLASRTLRVVLTFHAIAACFVVFRSPTWSVAESYFAGLIAADFGVLQVAPPALFVLALAIGLEVTPRSLSRRAYDMYLRLPAVGQAGLHGACLFAFAVFGTDSPPFIYFQF
ncbi:MAG: MBOAT family O-acyltransferase [Planctomycetota bacterium]|jgi:D-alanyl-lipoteichoic acid acyltransferase DltB (MBOAT superfamily)